MSLLRAAVAWLCGALLGLVGMVWSPVALAQAPVVLLQQAQGLSLKGQVGVLVDPSARLTLQDIQQTGAALDWTYPQESVRPDGSSAWWLKVRLDHRSPYGDWLLQFPSTALRDIRVYGPYSEDGRAWGKGAASGLIRPYASRPLGLERTVYPLDLPAPGVYTLYVRVQNHIAQDATPTAWKMADYASQELHQSLFNGVVYGVLLTLLIYNLALLVVFRDGAYAYYVLVCVASVLTIGTFNGHTAHYLWPHSPWWIERSYVIFPALWLACSAGFARAFLSTRTVSRWADGLILATAALALASASIGVIGSTALAQRLNEILTLAGVAMITVVAIAIWRRGYAPAGWYLMAMMTMFACLVGVILVAWGWWNAPWVLVYGLEIGITAEMIGFALALSARVRRIRLKAAEMNRRATHLYEAAMTDPLTGLANRRGLAEKARYLLGRPGPHALILFDLNHFKPLNDTHGHEIGDAVLAEVGRRLQQYCRDRDVAARLGGDEFVVLLANCPPRPELDSMVQRLCDALSQPLLHDGQAYPIGVSAGVRLTPEHGERLQTLLRQADQAMYAAKKTRVPFVFAEQSHSQPADAVAPALSP